MSAPCPLCNETFSFFTLAKHASNCNGPSSSNLKRKQSDGPPLSAKLFHNKRFKEEPNDAPRETNSTFSIDDSPSSVALQQKSAVPLAEKLRPSDFESFFGHVDTLGPGSILRSILSNAESIPNMVLWGPPGCGKTSVANVVSKISKDVAKFVKMSACTCGVNEVKEVVKRAKNDWSMFKKRTILFMDEVHRFNKTQQDSFLPHIEAGTIVFIGATTENPSFSLNNALLSRCKVVTLEKLSKESITEIVHKALRVENISVGNEPEAGLTITEDAVKLLATVTDGDARAALNNLEIVLNVARNRGQNTNVTKNDVIKAVTRSSPSYDRNGEQHYHMASALQKSIRGSDDNAALYYLSRMLKGGEDPSFIARRLIRCASEDIGLADNNALSLAVSAMQGTQFLGRPECDVLLAQCAVYLARAPKSHEVYGALRSVYQLIDNPGEDGLPSVPLHLRQGGGKVGKELGWGNGYSFDLDNVGSINYMPEKLAGVNFFTKEKCN